MTILITGLINIIGFYFSARLISEALNKQNELRDRVQMLEVEICDLNKRLRVLK